MLADFVSRQIDVPHKQRCFQKDFYCQINQHVAPTRIGPPGLRHRNYDVERGEGERTTTGDGTGRHSVVAFVVVLVVVGGANRAGKERALACVTSPSSSGDVRRAQKVSGLLVVRGSGGWG